MNLQLNALSVFRDAWERLAAIGRTLSNANVAGNKVPPRVLHSIHGTRR